jgi:hypothetical protein
MAMETADTKFENLRIHHRPQKFNDAVLAFLKKNKLIK